MAQVVRQLSLSFVLHQADFPPGVREVEVLDPQFRIIFLGKVTAERHDRHAGILLGGAIPATSCATAEPGERCSSRPDGSPKRVGDTLLNPDLAATLDHLARIGPEDFNHGALAARMAVSDELVAAGYDVRRFAQTFPFAALHAIGIVDGACSDGADPQRAGLTIGV